MGNKPAPKGNKYKEKFKTQEERQKLCDAWCEHLQNGYSKQSFPLCDYDTIERYVKLYPADFPADRLEKAMKINRMFWEGLGIDGTKGKINNFNASSWKYNMANRFGWRDKQDHTSDNKPIPFIVKLTDEKEN